MCGQFTIEVEENEIITQIVMDTNKKYPNVKLNTGVIRPTNIVPVVARHEGVNQPMPMTWGFPKWDGKGVIINARRETALEKPMFKKSLLERRCVVPSTGFFEWTHDAEKIKYRFRLPDESLLYMAGIYQTFDGVPRFTILTTAANNSMIDVHNRMPVILRRAQANRWLKENSAIDEVFANNDMLEKVAIIS